MVKKLNSNLKEEYVRHAAALEALPEKSDQVLFNKFRNGEAELEDYSQYLSLLIKALYKQYSVKPIVLLDEYDVPLDSAYQHGYFDKFITTFTNMLSEGLKDNNLLGGAVITGCLQIAKNNLFTGLNNPRINNVKICNYFTTSFGFTVEEVKAMLDYYGLNDKFAQVKDWYDGYRFDGKEVYNPYSVCNTVYRLNINQNSKLINHWVKTSENKALKKMLASCVQNQSIKDKFEILVNGGSIETDFSTTVTYSDMLEDEKAIFGTLLFTGYLTLDTDGKLYVPNKEVLSTFKMLVDDYHKVLANSVSFNILNAFVEKDVKKISRYVSDVLFKSISVLDLGNNKEYSYHMLLTGMISVVASKEWTIKSNVESGNGFADIIIQNASTGIAIILELKVATSREEMLTKLDQADTYYGEDLIKQGYDVTRYAICFFKKEVEVKLFEDALS